MHPRHRTRAAAFTLVELLVVIAIIGILVAMLLPAVQSAREAARRMQCSNNIRQVALALHQYHEACATLPPGYGFRKPQIGEIYGSNQGGGVEWPWVMRILPYIEQGVLADKVDWNFPTGDTNSYNLPGGPLQQTIVSTPIALFICPSDPTALGIYNDDGTCFNVATPAKTKGRARISYAGNFGRGQMEGKKSPATGAAETVADALSRRRREAVFYYNSDTTFTNIRDGLSNTVMLSELIPGGRCMIRGTYSYDEGPAVTFDYTPNDKTPDKTRMCDKPYNEPNSVAPCYLNPSNHWGGFTWGGSVSELNMVQHTSRSMHTGGVMTARCDGSVGFVSDAIALQVWQGIGTPAGGEVIDASEL